MSCFWRHKWDKWKVVDHGLILSRADVLGLPIEEPEKRPQIGAWERQRRECSDCGKSQMREVTA